MRWRNAAFQGQKNNNKRTTSRGTGRTCYASNRADLTLLASGTADLSEGHPNLAVQVHPSEWWEVLWRWVAIAKQGHHGGGRGRRRRGWRRHVLFLHRGVLSIPAILLDHVSQLDDVLALLVLLARLKGMFIFPTKCGFAAFTVDVGHRMETCE